MNFVESLRSAVDSLRANSLRTSLTMLGMTIGVAAIILLISIGDGTKNYVTRMFHDLGTNLIIIQPGRTETKSAFGPPPGGATRKLTIEDTRALGMRGTLLAGVAPVMFGSSRVERHGRGRDVMVLGTDDQFPEIINQRIGTGRFISSNEAFSGRRVCTIGEVVREQLFGNANALGEIVKISRTDFRVVGVMEKKGTALGIDMDDLIFIPVRAYEKLFDETGLFGIRAKARSQEELDAAVEQARMILKRRHHGEEDFTMISQDAMMSTMGTILDVLTYTLAGIAGISLVVGGIGIMNTLLVSVTERTREVGLRMAVGARRGDILKQFLTESVLISLLGGGVGVAMGVFGSWGIGLFSEKFQPQASAGTLGLAISFSVAVGVVFGVYPAWRAAAMDPILALRRE